MFYFCPGIESLVLLIIYASAKPIFVVKCKYWVIIPLIDSSYAPSYILSFYAPFFSWRIVTTYTLILLVDLIYIFERCPLMTTSLFLFMLPLTPTILCHQLKCWPPHTKTSSHHLSPWYKHCLPCARSHMQEVHGWMECACSSHLSYR